MVPRSPVRLTCLIAGVIVLVAALTAAGGRGAPAPPMVGLDLASGTLALSNSIDGTAVLAVQGMKPGASAGGTVVLSNTGSIDAAFSLAQQNLVEVPGTFGGQPSNHLLLAVEQLSAGGSTAQSLYSGVMAGIGSVPLGTLRAGETRSYRFTVSFPDGGRPGSPTTGDNLFQSASVQVDYVWTASGDDPGGGGGAGSGGGGSGGGGGGGGLGGGPGTGPGPGSGQSPLVLKLSGKRKQRPLRRRRLTVQAMCNTTCRLSPALSVRKARGLRKLRARGAMAVGGKRKRITFKLSRKKAKALRRALRRRKRVPATVVVSATVGAAKVTAKRRVILLR